MKNNTELRVLIETLASFDIADAFEEAAIEAGKTTDKLFVEVITNEIEAARCRREAATTFFQMTHAAAELSKCASPQKHRKKG